MSVIGDELLDDYDYRLPEMQLMRDEWDIVFYHFLGGFNFLNIQIRHLYHPFLHFISKLEVAKKYDCFGQSNRVV